LFMRVVWLLIIFAFTLIGAATLGPLAGAAVGLAAALLLAPWNSVLLRRRAWLELQRLLYDESRRSLIERQVEEERWKPIEQLLHFAMNVEQCDVAVEFRRDLSDFEIARVLETEARARAAGVEFEIADGEPSTAEPVVDVALRWRRRRPITLPSSY